MSSAPTKFVIFSVQRSGTTLLCDLLHSSRHIHCDHEIFHIQSTIYREVGVPCKAWFGQPVSSLQAYWKNRQQKPVKACGMKILENQCPEAFDVLIEDSSVKKIILERRNIIKHYYSVISAKKYHYYRKVSFGTKFSTSITAIYNALLSGQPKKLRLRVMAFFRFLKHTMLYVRGHESPRVRIDTEKMMHYVRQRKAYINSIKETLEKHQQDYFYMTYEDLTGTDQQALLKRLQIFLDVPVVSLSTSEKKIHTKALPELIENFDEVKNTLSGTEYAIYTK